MKVSDLINQLTVGYSDNLDAEIFAMYWDKEIIASYFDVPDAVTDWVWSSTVSEVEGDEYIWQSEATDTLIEVLRENAEELGIDLDGSEKEEIDIDGSEE